MPSAVGRREKVAISASVPSPRQNCRSHHRGRTLEIVGCGTENIAIVIIGRGAGPGYNVYHFECIAIHASCSLVVSLCTVPCGRYAVVGWYGVVTPGASRVAQEHARSSDEYLHHAGKSPAAILVMIIVET